MAKEVTIEKVYDLVDRKMAEINPKIDRVDSKVEKVDEKVDVVSNQVSNLKGQLMIMVFIIPLAINIFFFIINYFSRTQ